MPQRTVWCCSPRGGAPWANRARTRRAAGRVRMPALLRRTSPHRGTSRQQGAKTCHRYSCPRGRHWKREMRRNSRRDPPESRVCRCSPRTASPRGSPRSTLQRRCHPKIYRWRASSVRLRLATELRSQASGTPGHRHTVCWEGRDVLDQGSAASHCASSLESRQGQCWHGATKGLQALGQQTPGISQGCEMEPGNSGAPSLAVPMRAPSFDAGRHSSTSITPMDMIEVCMLKG